MFTINIYLRFALIAVCLIGGIAMWATLGVWYGIWFVLIGLVLLAGYIMLGTVQSAAALVQMQDVEGADKRLSLTLNPKFLYVTNRAYYYMLKGSIAQMKGDSKGAEENLKMAQSLELPTDNEKAMIELQLANIAANKGNWTQAKTHARALKDLKVTEPMMKEQIKQLEQVLKQSGAIRSAGMQGGNGFRPGGKRRRPKMR